jgi:hypothetical protein
MATLYQWMERFQACIDSGGINKRLFHKIWFNPNAEERCYEEV